MSKFGAIVRRPRRIEQAGQDARHQPGEIFLARVEQGDSVQIIDNIRAHRRVDLDRTVEAGVHFLLNQRGVKMAGVEDDQRRLLEREREII